MKCIVVMHSSFPLKLIKGIYSLMGSKKEKVTCRVRTWKSELYIAFTDVENLTG